MFIYLKGGEVINAKKNILIEDEFIKEISDKDISLLPEGCQIIDCTGLTILPGIIDTHVHFRQPGAEYKADMVSESRAALLGGVTSVFDMPNNSPAITDKERLSEKYSLCKENMRCNYSLYFGITDTNIDEALNLEKGSIAGLKLFLGSSTGNMLVNDKGSIEKLFKKTPFIITAHCEDETLIRENIFKFQNSESLSYNIHSLIRDEDVCYRSSLYAVLLAKKYNTPFHLAHLTTAKEISLLDNGAIENKNITSEVSPNHLFFCDEDYKEKGWLIKCNPSIKTSSDRKALRQALKEGFIDMISTDHAPHLLEEKQKDYFSSPSGIPSIQFSLLMMLHIAREEHWDLSLIAKLMAENPAKRFSIHKRGFIKEGYYADFVFVQRNKETKISRENIASKCKWSPLENFVFHDAVRMTMINGEIVAQDGRIIKDKLGKRLIFD
ncbi:MAG: dihydroorotase [Bacteroidales bacterium]|nr:dihydroorotase [Bacteroidales bacterium]